MPLFFIYKDRSLCYCCMLLILSTCILYFLLYINIYVYIFYILVLNVKKHAILNLEKIYNNDYICNISFFNLTNVVFVMSCISMAFD